MILFVGNFVALRAARIFRYDNYDNCLFDRSAEVSNAVDRRISAFRTVRI